MHWKKKISKQVYGLYLNSVSVQNIAYQTNLGEDDVNEIIDYMNEIYV